MSGEAGGQVKSCFRVRPNLETRVEDNEVVKIDTGTLQVVQRRVLAAGSSPIRIWPSPLNAEHMLVNHVGSGKLEILKVFDLTSVQEIQVGRQPIGLATSDGHHAFVANMKDDHIMKIDLRDGKVVKTYPTGASPDGIAFAR